MRSKLATHQAFRVCVAARVRKTLSRRHALLRVRLCGELSALRGAGARAARTFRAASSRRARPRTVPGPQPPPAHGPEPQARPSHNPPPTRPRPPTPPPPTPPPPPPPDRPPPPHNRPRQPTHGRRPRPPPSQGASDRALLVAQQRGDPLASDAEDGRDLLHRHPLAVERPSLGAPDTISVDVQEICRLREEVHDQRRGLRGDDLAQRPALGLGGAKLGDPPLHPPDELGHLIQGAVELLECFHERYPFARRCHPGRSSPEMAISAMPLAKLFYRLGVRVGGTEA